MLTFDPLWNTLKEKNMKRITLIENKVITPSTLAKLGKDSNVNSDTIDKICKFLHCPISDVVEFVDE